MLRSDINSIIEEASAFLAEQHFRLPPFAFWTPQEWKQKGPEVLAIVERRLGWDITDFGSGNFRSTGLFLFTLRNGDLSRLGTGRGMLYGEKILIVDPDQVTPMHRHKVKTEDIINRGGGELAIQLYESTPEGALDDRDVVVDMDGVEHRLAAGSIVTLNPGQSITLHDGLYHEFWGVGSRVLVGEVSLVNDDATDNYFYDEVGRFPDIKEDEAPRNLLVSDYERHVSFHV